MSCLQKQIEEKLEILKEMIHQGKTSEEINKQKKELDKLLIEYTKDLK